MAINTLNDRLNDVEIIFKGKIHGPEAFESYNDELYTGLHGGYIVKLKENQDVVPVAKLGKKCGKFNHLKKKSSKLKHIYL